MDYHFQDNTLESDKLNRLYFTHNNENLLNISYCTQGTTWRKNMRQDTINLNLNEFQGMRCIEPITIDEISKRFKFHSTKRTDYFYQYRRYITKLPIKITHIQVRKNFYKLGNQIIYSKNLGIEALNLVTNKQQTLCALSSEDEHNPDKHMICFDVIKDENEDYILCTGKSDGSVSLYKIPKREFNRVKDKVFNVIPKFENFFTKKISFGMSNEILTNYVKFLDNGKFLLTTNNDGHARIFDMNAELKMVNDYSCDFPINHCDFSDEILACVGDSIYVNLIDLKTKGTICKYPAHYDYGTVVKFMNNDKRVFATGNQDITTKLWDLRKTTCETKCLYGHIDSIGDLLFTPDDKFLIYAENTNYLHLYKVKDDTIQTMTYLGYFAGLAYDKNLDNIYVGVQGYSNSGIMCYDKIKNYKAQLNELNI